MLCVAVALILGVVGCGGSDSSDSAFKSLQIQPATVKLGLGALNSFTALLDGSGGAVRWTVVTPDGGTITSEGGYKAPQKSGTYQVKVELVSDPSKNATATVTVDSNYTVSVAAQNSNPVATGDTQVYVASVSGASNQAVTWTASAGTISPTGSFTAPEAVGPVTITATSVADPAKSKQITVNVVPQIAIVTPATIPLTLVKSNLFFAAQVKGANSTAVTWSATAGTIGTDGKFTAPDSSGTVTVTATSTADTTKKVSVDVTVVTNLNVRLKIQGKDDIVFALRPDKAPNTCANFVSLVNKKFYDGIIFHRYEPGFVIQGGDPLTKTLPLSDPSIGTGGPGYSIPFEANDLLHTKYALAMARSSDPDSAGSQFYVTLEAQPSLDGSYVVYGSVQSGFAVIDALRKGDVIVSATTEAIP